MNSDEEYALQAMADFRKTDPGGSMYMFKVLAMAILELRKSPAGGEGE